VSQEAAGPRKNKKSSLEPGNGWLGDESTDKQRL
jgi:hypothetical protein